MTLRFQRLILILITFVMLLSAVLLILFNSKKNIIFFYTPSELIENNHPLQQVVRVGALVEKESLKKISEFPANLELYPGHGNSTTMQYVLENNSKLKALV